MSAIDNGKGVHTRMQQGRMQVKVPYSPDFVVFAHSCGGRWKKRSGMWSFKGWLFPSVAAALNKIYGTEIKYRTSETPSV